MKHQISYFQLVVEMRECLLGLEQMLNSRCCLGIRIKLLTLPIFQLDTVLEHDLQDGVVGAAHILHLLQSVLVGDNSGSVGDL